MTINMLHARSSPDKPEMAQTHTGHNKRRVRRTGTHMAEHVKFYA